MPRTDIIVTLDDGLDHIVGDQEVTICDLPVPHGLEWKASTSKPCPVCFPDAKAKKKG